MRKLSIDAFENVKLMASIAINVKQSNTLTELAICGYRMTDKCAELLNTGLMQSKTVTKVRLNFCIYKIKILEILLPGLTKNMNIEEIDLSANDLHDDSQYLLNKLI